MSILEIVQPALNDASKMVLNPAPAQTSSEFGIDSLVKSVFEFLKSDTGKMIVQRFLTGAMNQSNNEIQGVPVNDAPYPQTPMMQNSNTQQIPQGQKPQQLDFKQSLMQILMDNEGRANIKKGLNELISYIGDVKISELIKHIDTLDNLFGKAEPTPETKVDEKILEKEVVVNAS